jgi:uracil-DNA glycosylase family 4
VRPATGLGLFKTDAGNYFAMDDDRPFIVEQLKAHLEFFGELGVESIAPEALNCLRKKTIAKTNNAALAPKAAVAAQEPVQRAKSKPDATLKAFAGAPSPSYQSLESIREDIGDCRRCKLCAKRTNIVFGSGNPQARLVFVGEGPGADEDEQGLPFVGRAGQLLTKIIESIQLSREEVYICNVVKCRPPENRVPEKDEIAACSPFMRGQLAVIGPRIICCLGATAAQTLLETTASMGKLRGRFYEFGEAQLIATYHPAYLLRNPAAKRDVWEDMKKIRALMESEKEAGRW